MFIPLLWSASAAAANRYHEFGGNINMLASSLAPVPSQNNRLSIGFGGGLAYSWHFNDVMAIRTGLQGNYYRSTTAMSALKETSRILFPEEWNWGASELYDYFDFTSNLETYTAQQSTLYLQVPVLFEYLGAFTPNNTYLGWYLSAGFKVGYAIMGSSNASFKGLKTSVLLGEEGVDIGEDSKLQDLGWGIKIDNSVTSPLDMGFSSIAYLEAGFTQQLTTRHILYAGVFGEYSIYSVVGSASSVMLEYEPRRVDVATLGDGEVAYQFRYHPAANVSANNVKSNYFLSFGITVRIGLSFNKRTVRRNERLFNVRYFQY
ncbi:MAG: PorT family protein [Prevotellaceae bacterium]|nr:PorT family protein [Prevotellaceae bacterium]